MNTLILLTVQRTSSFMYTISKNIVWASGLLVLLLGMNVVGKNLNLSEPLLFVLPFGAVVVGLFVQIPALRGPLQYAALITALVFSLLLDKQSYSRGFITLGVTLLSIGLMTFLILRMSIVDQHLQHPRAVLVLFLICLIASYAKGLTSCFLAKLLLGQPACAYSTQIFATELMNSMLVLPVMLTFPRISFKEIRGLSRRSDAYRVLALLCLLSTLIASAMVGGPGALTFPLPALLWISLYFGVFVSALLTCLTSYALIVMLQLHSIAGVWMGEELIPVYSMYIGIALIALCPLILASAIGFYREQIRNLRHHALYDMLSGGLVRSAFKQQAEESMDFSRRYERSLATIMLDIDNFKRINDSYGHSAGDKIITALGKTILTNIRDSDLFGRIGGEEFVILLHGIPRDSAQGIAEAIARQFSTVPHNIGQQEVVWVTVSIGIYHTPSLVETLEEVMEKADKALYYAKTHGKNRVVFYNDIALGA